MYNIPERIKILGKILMKVKAWNNGSYSPDGNGYGLKITTHDRDASFRREWKTIWLELAGESDPVEINIDKDSFWNNTCRELISVRIGRWLIKNRLAPWRKGYPPVLTIVQVEGKQFKLEYAKNFNYGRNHSKRSFIY